MADDPSITGIERMLRMLVARERLANTLSADAVARQNELFRRIEALLRRMDPTAVGPTRYRKAREEKFIRELSVLLRDFAPEFEAAMRGSLAQIGRAQAVQAHVDILATIGSSNAHLAATHVGITQARLRVILNTDPFMGRTLREHSRRIAADTLDRVRTELRAGMAAEESIGDIVRRVRGTQAGYLRQDPVTGAFVPKGTRGAVVRPRFQGGVLAGTTRNTTAMVRTAVTFISNEAMLETFRENSDVVAGVRFSAALDDRTTPVCLSLDGTVWAAGDGRIETPPLHYQCRSILVPEFNWEALGLPAPPEVERTARDMSTVEDSALSLKVSARRRERIGSGQGLGEVTKLSSNQVGERWFREQRFAVQQRIVGATRARAYREGRIANLRDLIAKDNTLLPLSELGL